MSPNRLDDYARALAPAMSRRQTLRAAAGLALAAFLPAVRPSLAGAAGIQDCAGRNELCPTAGHVNCGHSTVGETGACCCYCCATGDQCTCVGNRCFCCENKCGKNCCQKGDFCRLGECFTCAADKVCGTFCCKEGEYCETRFLGTDTCEKLCPHTHLPMCIGVCCTENETCGFFGCKCKSGFVSTGAGTCVPPKEDPGDPPATDWFATRLASMMSQTAAAHSTGHRRALFARPATSGSAAVDAALDALAAVNGQAATAAAAIRYGKRDPAYKQKVSVARATPPTLSAGAGLDANSVAALNALLVAEARANALIAAMAKALWRARAAHAKHDRAAAKRQLRVSAAFAAQAVTALKPLQALRTAAANALTAGRVAEVLASEDAVAAFIATVTASGIPATLSAPMGKLGVGSADLKNLRARVLERTASSATGPALIAPLTDPARANALKSLITELSKFSTRARKHPIAH